MANDGWMIYGANGYTGKIIAERAVQQGKRPVLAGRREQEVKTIAGNLGLEWRCFDLKNSTEVEEGIQDMNAVLHCAGPFSKTSAPMVDACLNTNTHYLDITGEIPVFEHVQTLDAKAKAAGCVLLPGVGFDVVPSDCLAALLAQRLPDATHLELAFAGAGGISPGTSKTIIEMLPDGGLVRRDGKIISVPFGAKRKAITFSDQAHWCMTIPWGDVSTAYHSTGIPNIEIFIAVPRAFALLTRVSHPLLGLSGLPVAQKFLKGLVDKYVNGPNEASRKAGSMHLWGQVRNARGQAIQATLDVPEGYEFTVHSSLVAMERVLKNTVAVGAQTPSKAFGADFVTQLPGVSLNI